MGAQEFFISGYGNSAKQAFDACREDALYESGHGGYSGTIAEKHNFVTIDKFETYKEAFEKAQELLDAADHRIDDKWGPAGCIEFKKKDGTQGYLFFGWASS